MDLTDEIEAMRVFDAALQVPPGARAAWLAAQDLSAAVATRVHALLAADDDAGTFLERPAAASMPSALPRPGDRLGAWRIERELDAGGMGVVYLASRADGAYDQQAAIKLVRSTFDAGSRAELVARFDNERRLLARIDHPNVARVLDGGSTADGWPYLVMEYIDGLSLTAYCERRRLDVPARVALFCKVCDGVEAAHRHLIVHRDLKPHNILVGSDGEPRLLDFGIARRLEREADPDATHTSMRAMTPAYASPEQVRGEPLTTASDVYSLGVVLFELLAGARPYSLDGLSPAQSEHVICETDPPTLRRALANAPLPENERRARSLRIGNDLERILARAMHKAPERRYGSAQSLGDDLRRQRAGLPVHAHPDSLGYRVGKFVRRHRAGSAVGAIALVAVLAAAGVALLQASEARRAARDTAQVNAFLVDMLNLSNPYMADGEVSLADALDEAAAQVDTRFADRPDLAADIRYALGQSMLGRYRLDEAQVQLERSLADSERVNGRDATSSIRAVATLASVQKERGDFAAAEAGYADALARIERGGHTRDAWFATVLNDAGVMHLLQEQYEQARGLFERALAVGDAADEPPSQEERTQTLGNLAHALRGMGELDRADALYAEVQASFEALYPDGGPYQAIVLNNRARLANQRGLYEQALDLQQQAVAMHRRAFTGDHVMVLTPMTNLARQARDLDRLDLAEQWAVEAVAMADRLYADTPHAYHVNALAALADVRLAQGRDEEGAALLRRALDVLARVDAVPASTADFVASLRTTLCEGGSYTRYAACVAPAGSDAKP